MPLVGLFFGKLDFPNLFVVLGTMPEGVPRTLDALKKAGIPVFAYGNFITVCGELRDSGLHHFHGDGQTDKPPQTRGSACTGASARFA